MTVEQIQLLSIVLFVLAGVLFLLAIALFFLLDIPKLYGDISGRTAKKAIEAIRRQNESSGNRASRPSVVNAARGKLTAKITPSGRLAATTDSLPIHVGTEKFNTDILTPNANETTVLASETTVLESEATAAQGETTVLSNETTLLTGVGSECQETTILVGGDGTGFVPTAEEPFTAVAEASEDEATEKASDITVDVEMGFKGSTELIE